MANFKVTVKSNPKEPIGLSGKQNVMSMRSERDVLQDAVRRQLRHGCRICRVPAGDRIGIRFAPRKSWLTWLSVISIGTPLYSRTDVCIISHPMIK